MHKPKRLSELFVLVILYGSEMILQQNRNLRVTLGQIKKKLTEHANFGKT